MFTEKWETHSETEAFVELQHKYTQKKERLAESDEESAESSDEDENGEDSTKGGNSSETRQSGNQVESMATANPFSLLSDD